MMHRCPYCEGLVDSLDNHLPSCPDAESFGVRPPTTKNDILAALGSAFRLPEPANPTGE